MKKMMTPKKLTLSRETLSQLTTQQAQAVQGAMTNSYCCTTDTVQACCA